MKKYLVNLLIPLLTILTVNVAIAGTTGEEFSSSIWQSEAWMTFSGDRPLDNMPETPYTIIRSAYDWTKGVATASGTGGNTEHPAYPDRFAQHPRPRRLQCRPRGYSRVADAG